MKTAGSLRWWHEEIAVFQEPSAPSPSMFVVAGSAYAVALRERFCDDPTVAVFSEDESLQAMRAILARPPKILALDSTVARTARGALLVSRLKANADVDVRVLREDDSGLPLLLARPDMPLHAASEPIDGCGTRAARRFPMAGIDVVIDGERSRLVNLSVTGAQVVLPARVQPGQSVRFTLPAEPADRRFGARVAWSSVELTPAAVRYRAGLAFADPDTDVLEIFCIRHGGLS
jgi:hypothetical protein